MSKKTSKRVQVQKSFFSFSVRLFLTFLCVVEGCGHPRGQDGKKQKQNKKFFDLDFDISFSFSFNFRYLV